MNREKRVTNILLIVYLAISTAFLSLPLALPVRSLKACISYLLNPMPFYGSRAEERLSAIPGHIKSLISTDIENRNLREEVRQLSLVGVERDSLRRENDRLRTELAFRPSEGRALRWARVIERDPMNWYRTLMIDAGQNDGVEINSPVLGLDRGRAGAIGRITEVGTHWAKVLLLTDEVSSVAAYLPSQGWEGLVEGQGGSKLRMNYLPLDAKVSLGDPIYTSVTSATFPQDILIGRVSRLFQQDAFLTFQSVEVAPEIYASALKEVLILVPKKIDLPPASLAEQRQ